MLLLAQNDQPLQRQSTNNGQVKILHSYRYLHNCVRKYLGKIQQLGLFNLCYNKPGRTSKFSEKSHGRVRLPQGTWSKLAQRESSWPSVPPYHLSSSEEEKTQSQVAQIYPQGRGRASPTPLKQPTPPQPQPKHNSPLAIGVAVDLCRVPGASCICVQWEQGKKNEYLKINDVSLSPYIKLI